jgi:trigger factor
MKAEIIKRTDTRAKLKISADEAELTHAKAHVYEHWRPRVKTAGSRRGKAPDHIVGREVGDQTMQSETLEYALIHTYSQAVSEHKLAVLAQPEIQVKKFVPYSELEYEATVDLVPPIKLPDYTKIKKPFKPAMVSQAQISEVLEELRRRLAKRVPVKRGAEMGDEVKIDFEGKRGDQLVPGAAAKNHTLKLGSKAFISGFEEAIVGLKPGDKKTVTVTFPKDYHQPTLAGLPVEFAISVHEVVELALPVLDDRFASEVGPFQKLAELKQDIKKQQKAEAETAAKRKYESQLLDDIVGRSKLEAPESLVAQQLERLKSEMNQRLASSGLDLEKYLASQNKTPKQLDQELRPEAKKRVKVALVLWEVAKAEQLSVTNDEVDSEIASLRQRYTDPQMQKELDSEHTREEVFNHLLASRVVNKLVEYART